MNLEYGQTLKHLICLAENCCLKNANKGIEYIVMSCIEEEEEIMMDDSKYMNERIHTKREKEI